jgi:heme/copper-type cytochrome/quinol oxidase subunit 2
MRVERSPWLSSKLVILIFTGTILVAAFGLYYMTQLPNATAAEGTPISGVSCASYSSSYTIMASETGYNDSIGHGAPKTHWPVLCVHSGQDITITVVNHDAVEPHGLAIRNYDEGGVTVLPGGTVKLTFFANKLGDYLIFCNVICAIHPFMQSGVLVVSQ